MKKKECKNNNHMHIMSLGGTISRLTNEGIETTYVKGKKPYCINCGKKL